MFTRHLKTTASIILASSLLIACSNTAGNKQAKAENPSGGFLSNHYTLLQPATSPSGQPVMRWINPKLKNANYDRILIDTPIMTNSPDNAANRQLVSDIKATIQKDMSQKLQGIFGITTIAKPRTLRLRTAISGIDAKKIVSPVAIPVDLLTDDEKPMLTLSNDVVLFIEFELTDAMTGELLGVGIRRNDAKALPQDLTNVTLSQIAPMIDSWAHDARLFFKKT